MLETIHEVSHRSNDSGVRLRGESCICIAIDLLADQSLHQLELPVKRCRVRTRVECEGGRAYTQANDRTNQGGSEVCPL